MGHVFHDFIDKIKQPSIEGLSYIYGKTNIKDLGTNDEELYNITGYFYENNKLKFDPTNCNMYKICKACNTINSRSKISQRVFHISYISYKSKSFKQRRSIKSTSKKLIF